MRKTIIAILATVGGGLAAWKGTDYFFNYRELPEGQWVYMFLLTAVVLLCLGVYIIAWVFQQLSNRRADVEPSFLVVGAIGGLLLSSIPTFLPPPTEILSWIASWFPVSLIPIWLCLVGVWIACQFERPKANVNPIILLTRALIPALLVGLLIWVQNSGFPGVAAPAEVRQQWASKEFQGYDRVVETIKQCQPIIQRVGRVQWVAPAQGRNYVISDLGSSRYEGEMTLEVVGDQGAGVANFSLHRGLFVTPGQFAYQSRTEKIVCR